MDKYNIYNDELYPLILSNKFIKILNKIDDVVSDEILKLFNNKTLFKETYVDITNKNDTITFIMSEKVNKMILDKTPNLNNSCWNSNQRIEMKLGRFVFRLIGDKIPAHEIEAFVNEYKSIIQYKKLFRNFKIVDGENIKKWYLQDTYTQGGGNLKNSCMRHNFCQSFFDIYTKNSDKIKLLILLDENKDKILGRALLWKLDQPDGRMFMDRVYYSHDFVLNMFINHAIKNRWLYKLENLDNIFKVVDNHHIVNMTMYVKIQKINYITFPFVDNLGFYDPISSILSNDPKVFKKLGRDKYYDLCDHTGGYEIRNDFDF